MGPDDPIVWGVCYRIAEADATEELFCDKELSETNAKKDDTTGEIEKLTAKIDKMTGMRSTAPRWRRV